MNCRRRARVFAGHLALLFVSGCCDPPYAGEIQQQADLEHCRRAAEGSRRTSSFDDYALCSLLAHNKNDTQRAELCRCRAVCLEMDAASTAVATCGGRSCTAWLPECGRAGASARVEMDAGALAATDGGEASALPDNDYVR
jgi:hypothetical protein